MISLFRLDDRLIHGQVVIGWGIKLNPDKYVIIDDDIEEWESDLYLGCLENESQGQILTTAQAKERFKEWQESKDHIVILIKCTKTLKTLIEMGVHLPDINVGGLHYLEGKKQYLKCMYLYDDECETLRELIKNNSITYQPLPSDIRVDLKNILSEQSQKAN
ncbi:MAG: PTS sugar transporter subunit IIB [Calditrichaeota bacterium]|nr:PTS sugar transporter subunit IIB [Calditrichota bacterium]